MLTTLATTVAIALSLSLGAAPPPAAPPPGPALGPALSPARTETVRFHSSAVGQRRAYLAILPPGYDPEAPSPYPVVYLLHGLGGEPGDWLTYARIAEVAADAVRSGEVGPMVFIAPDGGNHYWTDHVGRRGKPGPRWGAFVADDVVADVERRFHVRTDRPGRAVVGVSMGGHGAMSLALQHPERFGAAVSLAGALFPEAPTHRKVYKTVWGDPPDPDHWARTSPIHLLRELPADRMPAIFIHCGDDDGFGFLDHALLAQQILHERDIPHEFRLNDGGHVWSAWTAATDEWLRFVDWRFGL